MEKEIKYKTGKYPSIYEEFEPGERVIRQMRKENGDLMEYEGIIMGIEEESIDIYWDTIDGEYCPEAIENDFTQCSLDEIYNGTEEYTPIKRKKEEYELEYD